MVETTSGSAKVTFPSDTEFLITREFAAPPHLVYKAWTTPELVERYWAGKQGTMKSVDIDLREGGSWRYVMDSSGYEVAFHGEYSELVENQRIVTTEVYEGAPEGTEPALNLITFTETANGGTRARAAGAARRQGDPRRDHRHRHGDRDAGAVRPARRAGPLARLSREGAQLPQVRACGSAPPSIAVR